MPGEEGAPSPREGLPLLAAAWNDIGLFLKEGRLKAAVPDADGRLRITLEGSKSVWIQRRRHVRILILEEFVQAEGLSGLYDLSASGLSYFSPDPPRLRSTLSFTLRFGKDRPGIDLTAVVTRCSLTPRRKHMISVEFLSDLRTTDRLATLVQECQRKRQASSRQLA
jgi:hypothetical protein